MKKIVMIFAAMAAVLSSCQKSELESVSANEIKDIVLNISVSNPGAGDTKALVKTGWVKDDQIKIWFDDHTGDTPDLVIKYDGSDWEGTPASTPSSSGYIKAVYNNYVIVASKDNYTYTDNTLSFHIENWIFLTEIQVVVKGIPYYYDATYKLSCDKFTPVTRAGFTVGTEGITAAKASKGDVAKGISNADGVAFVFATADYSSSSTDKKDFTFTLTDDITGSEVTKVYKVNTAIEAKGGKSSIKALTIASSKFTVVTGTAKRKLSAESDEMVDVNWVQLWAGGPKFAEYNVGVTNGKAESYGGYYTWGGTYNNDSYLPDFSWNDDHNLLHTTDNDNLTSTEDTATKLWGENWRMPTKAELEALINSTNCTVEWTTVGGVYGRKFTGKTEPYSSNSVFLPAAGCCYKNSEGDIERESVSYGYYWSSTSKDSNNAYCLYFHESSFQTVATNGRHIGSSVRAVLAK